MEWATEPATAAGEDWWAGLGDLHARIAGRFGRAEVRVRTRRYLEGLLGTVERKNGWQLAEHLGEAGPQGVQRLLNCAEWDADLVRDDLRAYVVEALGDPEGLLILDESGFLKKGTKSAGVARQYSGTAGRRENCQTGVFLAYASAGGAAFLAYASAGGAAFLAYASAGGAAFLDRALYLPEAWAQDAARREEAGIPGAVAFATKGELAKAMLARAFAAGVPAAWVVGDTVYGGDELRRWLEEQGKAYVLAVPCTHLVWTEGRQVEARALAAGLAVGDWAPLPAGDGSQGPRWYDWACLALPYAAAEGRAHRLLVRRSRSDPAELAYYRVHAPLTTPVAAMVRAAGGRWAIEVAFEQAKGEVGLDEYEVRRSAAWYRHVTLALLAHAYLVAARRGAAAAKGAATATVRR